MRKQVGIFRRGLAVIGVWAGVTVLGALGEEPLPAAERLSRLQTTYAASLGRIETDTLEKRNAQREQYLKGLALREEAAQKAGQLEAVLAVREEAARYKADSTVPPSAVTATWPDLQKLQQGYMLAAQEVELERCRKVVALAGLYERSLATLQAQLTKEGNVDAALEVKAERDGVATRPEVSAARFAVTEAEARQPKLAPAPVTEPAKEPAKPTLSHLSGSRKSPTEIKNYIKKRYESMVEALTRDDKEKAAQFINPEQLKRRGTDGVKMHLGWLVPFLRGARALNMDIEAGKVELAEDQQSASVTPRVRVANEWQEKDPSRWVLIEGEWYMDL